MVKHTFYRLVNGEDFKEEKGIRIIENGLTVYCYKNKANSVWLIEEKTGCKIAEGRTNKDALNNLKNIISLYGMDIIISLIDKSVSIHGTSPLFKHPDPIKQ